MLASTLLSVLPVLALAAPAFASPIAKKRACARPSASASTSASVSASISGSASITVSSAIESASASASASESAAASETSSVNTGVFAPGQSASASASLEPTSTVEPSASASASASEEASSTSASASAEPAQSSAPATSSDADLFVKLHNDFRAQYSAPAVEWDEELATFAKNYAPICKMVHSDGQYGENLAGGAGDGYDITRAFNSWAAEGDHYDWSKPGVLETEVDGKPYGLGHFTQLVWKETTKIGCAAVTCDAGSLFEEVYGESTFVVCEYSPAGNVYLGGEGQDPNALFVDNVGIKI